MGYVMLGIVALFCCGPIIVSQVIINHGKQFENGQGGDNK